MVQNIFVILVFIVIITILIEIFLYIRFVTNNKLVVIFLLQVIIEY